MLFHIRLAFCLVALIGNINAETIKSYSGGEYSSHLKYFGYFASSATFTEEKLPVDSTPEIYDHVNLVWISSWQPDLNERFSSVIAANKSGRSIKVIVNVIRTFFSGSYSSMREDYKSRWSEQIAVLKKYEEVILGFYVADEPFNKLRPVSLGRQHVVKLVNQSVLMIRSSFPSKEIWMSISHRQVLNSDYMKELLSLANTVSVTCYGVFEECGHRIKKRSIAEWYQILENVAPPNIDFFILPKTFIRRTYRFHKIDPLEEASLKLELTKIYSYAKENPRIKAFVPFLWQNYHYKKKNGQEVYVRGANGMRTLREQLYLIGKEVSDELR